MDPNLLNASDEDFLAGIGSSTEESGTAQAETSTENVEESTNIETVEASTEEGGAAAATESGTEEATTTSTTTGEETVELTEEEKAAQATTTTEEAKPATTEEPFDYKKAYETITAPFKANGKDIILKTPEEVIQMMQMGANYTRKMQSIAPHRKALMMLQNNELLDENKLAFLIDLNKKDPAAIQKLLKESGVNPLEVDVDAESTYTPGNHHVSDEQVALTSVLEDIASTQEGRETVQIISTEWDQASKEILMKDPNVLNVINQQRQNGVYDAITAEIERQKVVGTIPIQTPFLDAYRTVGSQLYGNTEKATVQTPTPVARTIPTNVTGKAATTEKIHATAPAKSIGKASVKIDPLSMSDDEFQKFMEAQV